MSAFAVLLELTGGPGVALADEANTRAALNYAVWASQSAYTVCVGDEVEFSVSIRRTTTINGERYGQWVSGGDIFGVIVDPHVGSFKPADVERPVGGGSLPQAIFVFRAMASGQTDIEFLIQNTGEEARVGTGFPQKSLTMGVKVNDCFDAYTSGLGTTFIDSDMGDLTEPFLLSGRINTSSVAGSSQYMFFAPNPQNRTTGRYTFIDTAWATADPLARCTAYISGRYDVVLYGDPAKPVEGDLLMKGTGVVVCTGNAMPIDYRAAPGFQILFRPRPAP